MNSSLTDKKEIKRFGLVALIFFGGLCALGLWRQKVIIASLFGVLSFLGFAFVLFPRPLMPIYKGWVKVADFIGKIITIIVLTLAYYLVITPSALVKRVLGGRPLPIRSDKNTDSYWVPRDEPSQPKERFIKRY
jgi:hypothetical protein